MKNVNERLIEMYTELDNQDGKLKMIACEIGFKMSANEKKKSKKLLEYLVKAKYESNLKLINSIINQIDKDD